MVVVINTAPHGVVLLTREAIYLIPAAGSIKDFTLAVGMRTANTVVHPSCLAGE